MKRKIFLTNFFADVCNIPIYDVSYHSHGGHVTLGIRNYSGSVEIFCNKSKNTGLCYITFKNYLYLGAERNSVQALDFVLKANFWLQMYEFSAVAEMVSSVFDSNWLRMRITSGQWPWQNVLKDYCSWQDWSKQLQTPKLKVESKQFEIFETLSENWSYLYSDIIDMLYALNTKLREDPPKS